MDLKKFILALEILEKFFHFFFKSLNTLIKHFFAYFLSSISFLARSCLFQGGMAFCLLSSFSLAICSSSSFLAFSAAFLASIWRFQIGIILPELSFSGIWEKKFLYFFKSSQNTVSILYLYFNTKIFILKKYSKFLKIPFLSKKVIIIIIIIILNIKYISNYNDNYNHKWIISDYD